MSTLAERAEARAAKKYARRLRGYNAAKARRCTACKRMNALGRPRPWDKTTARKCRYCGHWEVAACTCMTEATPEGERVVTHADDCPEYLGY